MPTTPSNRHLRDLPPRHLGLFTKIVILFGGFLQQFGWIFFTMGSLFAWIFIPLSDVMLWFEGNKNWEETVGQVMSAEPTNSSVNETTVYQYLHSFELEGERFSGKSFTVGRQYNDGEEVTIRYNADDPNESYIGSSRRAIFPAWVLFVLLFPLIGLAFIITSILQNIKVLKLLEIGEFKRGKLISKEATNARINKQTVFKYTFEFEVGGIKQEATCKTHQGWLVEDEEREIILYDRFNPTFNFVFDAMPNVPNISEEGRLERAPIRKALNLLLPILGIGLNVMFLRFMLATIG
jgi:hypothetical protein